MEIHQRTIEVLGPEIDKLKNFYQFQKVAITRFAKEIKRLWVGFDTSCTFQTTKITLGKMLNMFAVLDALKTQKAGDVWLQFWWKCLFFSGSPRIASIIGVDEVLH
jgi:cytoplasmic FMR1 interacting protein